jgi:syntaxin-binding protein 1
MLGEMRVVHHMARELDRDIILGSTSVDVPNTFVDLLYSISLSSSGL